MERARNNWFVTLAAGRATRLRLCCFPSAGGSASAFASWQSALPPWVELCALQLPGRASRWREPPVRDLSALVRTLHEAIAPLTGLPLVFFGHSNGAVIAYELARALAAGPACVAGIVLSSKPAPHFWRGGIRRHELDDEQLLEELRRFGGTPAELLEHRELLLQMLPTLRADFALAETHDFSATPLLDVPAALWWGEEDALVAPEQVRGWQRYLCRPAAERGFRGGHFYLQQCEPIVLEGLVGLLHDYDARCARRNDAAYTH